MGFPDRWTCKNCKYRNYNTRKCSKCGFTYSFHYPDLWQCPNCNKMVEASKRCPSCDYPKNLQFPDLWQCPYCNRLIRASKKCPYCNPSSIKRTKRLEFKVSKAVIIPLVFLLLLSVAIVTALNVNVPVNTSPSAASFIYNTTRTSIIFPTWSIVKQSDTYVKLYDEDSMQSIYYFINEPYFSTIRKDLYNVYSVIHQSFNLTITNEYSHDNWEVLCFNNDLFITCLSATKCGEDISYVQLTNYALIFNQSLYNEILDSFCCN